MKAFAKYLTLTLVIAVMVHYAVEKSALAGCQRGVFYMLNDMFDGIDYLAYPTEQLASATEKLCVQIMKKN